MPHVLPWQAIHHKEAELRHRLEEAWQPAQASFEQSLAVAQHEAKTILMAAREEAAALQQRVAARLDAAEQIVKLVLA
jgi:hypothetical protein